jgi:hypothetical protein
MLNEVHLFESFVAEDGFRAQQDAYFELGGKDVDADIISCTCGFSFTFQLRSTS